MLVRLDLDLRDEMSENSRHVTPSLRRTAMAVHRCDIALFKIYKDITVDSNKAAQRNKKSAI